MLGAGTGSTAAGARPDLVRAGLSQSGRSLVLTLRTATPVALSRLDRQPSSRRGARYLCLSLRAAGRRGERRLCLGGARGARRRVGLELLNAAGRPTGRATLSARVKRRGARKLILAIDPAAAGLKPHRYRWRVLENRRGCRARGCEEALPPRRARLFRLRPVRAVGCTGGRTGTVRHGRRDRRVVALTFDDGPSRYTGAFLDVLRRKRVPGTFFVVGQEIGGRAATMRRILHEGHEIANHTTHHGHLPGQGDLAVTNALIGAATRFRPCLFRPPGGALNTAVMAAAGAAGMKTVLWDVDPRDWGNPSSAAIHSRVTGAVRPGSIVVMHDGGGNRSSTLAALPRIVATLRGRGYRFATVTELLGHRMLYKPYG